MHSLKTAEDYFEEFRRLSEQPVRKRAKGISFNRIGFWSINTFLVAAGISAPLLLRIRARSYLFFLLVGYVVVWFVWGLPEYFYHQEKRRKRYLRRKYPVVFKAIRALREKGEATSYDAPPLHIDGEPYFLVSYFFRQPWWQIRPWVKLRGWIVFDKQGCAIQDPFLFAKAFVTMMHADLGAVETQKRQGGEYGELRFALRKYLPRAERLFKQQNFFLKKGLTYQQTFINARFPLYYQAVRDAMLFYEANKKFLEAIGYSFGLEFWYEDAVHAEKVRRAFGEYMRLKYEKELTDTLQRLVEIWKELPRHKSPRKYVLDLFARTLHQVLRLTYYALDSGIPTVSEWQAYVSRLEVARHKGIPVLEKAPLPEEYPFKGVLYHDDPWKKKEKDTSQ